MSSPPSPDTDQLLADASRGDAAARSRLLERHRRRLRQLVALRMDRRLAARVDPSDVVQEALAEAAAQMDQYLREQPLPFYPWLRRLTCLRLADAYRHHVQARRRTVTQEEPPALPGESVVELAERLVSPQGGPSARLRRRERSERVRAALEKLPERDREVLVLRFLEDLSTAEAAAVLGVGEGAVKMRVMRALQRLRDLLDEGDLP
jgi:RNA polymerase sigma-70 factor (ECF subfamily)